MLRKKFGNHPNPQIGKKLGDDNAREVVIAPGSSRQFACVNLRQFEVQKLVREFADCRALFFVAWIVTGLKLVLLFAILT